MSRGMHEHPSFASWAILRAVRGACPASPLAHALQALQRHAQAARRRGEGQQGTPRQRPSGHPACRASAMPGAASGCASMEGAATAGTSAGHGRPIDGKGRRWKTVEASPGRHPSGMGERRRPMAGAASPGTVPPKASRTGGDHRRALARGPGHRRGRLGRRLSRSGMPPRAALARPPAVRSTSPGHGRTGPPLHALTGPSRGLCSRKRGRGRQSSLPYTSGPTLPHLAAALSSAVRESPVPSSSSPSAAPSPSHPSSSKSGGV